MCTQCTVEQAAAITYASDNVLKEHRQYGPYTTHKSYAFAGLVFAGQPDQAACLQDHLKHHALAPS